MDQDTVPVAASTDRQALDLGNWLGRGQAFSFIANKCSAAQAECLRRIRQDGAYKSLGLTWDAFCPQYLGLSRSHADHLIRQLDQFGTAYFHLAEIMQISADSYRRIAGAIHDDSIEIGGQLVHITSENAPRIKQAILALQKDTQRARAQLAQAQAAHPLSGADSQLNVTHFQGWKLSWGGLSGCEPGFRPVQAGPKPGPQAGKPDPTPEATPSGRCRKPK